MLLHRLCQGTASQFLQTGIGIIRPTPNSKKDREPFKKAASALVFGNEVRLQTYGKDQYGRTLADVLLPNGTNVNHELVKAGWWWWHRKYAPEDTVLEGLEKDARDAKKGSWGDPQPMPPWEWGGAR